MCFECERQKIGRRRFLGSVTAAAVALAARCRGEEAKSPPPASHLSFLALADSTVQQQPVSFPSGEDKINGYLARPKAEGRHRAIVIMQGDPGLPDWVRNTAARLAQAGFVGLVIDINSRAVPDSTKLDKPLEYYISNTFDKQVAGDSLAAIAYLKQQPFTAEGGVGWVGFCGGGRKGLLLSTQSKDIVTVVSLYGAVRFNRKNTSDPMPDVMDVVTEIKVPVQGHYGTLDKVAPVADTKEFEQSLKAQGTLAEMYYYEGAGHGFYGNTWKEQTAEFGYQATAATAAHDRMVAFLQRNLR